MVKELFLYQSQEREHMVDCTIALFEACLCFI